MKTRLNQLQLLFEKCSDCYGEGKTRDFDSGDIHAQRTCERCNGEGGHLTEFGEHMLEFLDLFVSLRRKEKVY